MITLLFGMCTMAYYRTPLRWKGPFILGAALVTLLATAAWLAAPFALWSAWGAGWFLLWLIPTTTFIYATTAPPPSYAGG
jgi:hypothetical protein